MTGVCVVQAPHRDERPRSDPGDARIDPLPRWDPECPFCPGNEVRLPRILREVDGAQGEPWGARVVPNLYPAFGAPDPEGRKAAEGYQEIVIESPDHRLDLTTMSREEIARTVEAYRSCYRRVSSRPEIATTFLFRNRGRMAGASLAHPHTQVVGTAIVPDVVAARRRRFLEHLDATGRCLLCTLDEHEADHSARVVLEHGLLRAFVPWAAEAAYEVWFVPRVHEPDFGGGTAAVGEALAAVLYDVLGALRRTLGAFPYNLVLHSAESGTRPESAEHWFLQLRPRTSQLAGFELASGMRINPSDPVDDAATLRAALAASD